MGGERNVTQVVDETGRNQANVSNHAKMLAGAGLLGRRSDGLQVMYRLDDPMVENPCKHFCETIVQEGVEAQYRLPHG